jgi:hypothetical protein
MNMIGEERRSGLNLYHVRKNEITPPAGAC